MKTSDQVAARLKDLLNWKEQAEPKRFINRDEQEQWACVNAEIDTLIWVLED